MALVMSFLATTPTASAEPSDLAHSGRRGTADESFEDGFTGAPAAATSCACDRSCSDSAPRSMAAFIASRHHSVTVTVPVISGWMPHMYG